MSRIGRLPITVPAGVTVSVSPENVVTVKGPKGELKQDVNKKITVTVEAGVVHCTRSDEEKQTKAMHGLYRKLIANMVEGGRTPFLPARELQEIGYSAVTFPITTLYAAAKAVYDVLADLRENGTSAGSADRMLCFREFNELIGLPAVRKIESGDLSAVRRDLL